MAELSTIARPYAQGLIAALSDAKMGPKEAAELATYVDGIAEVVTSKEVVAVMGDPKLTNEQLYETIISVLGDNVPELVCNLVKVVVQNDRLDVMPEIARQFRELKNLSEGVADAYIESAYPLSDEEVDGLIVALGNRFPGVKLTPVVTVNQSLIGGVRVRVGDKTLDGSIQTRLAQMQEALTA